MTRPISRQQSLPTLAALRHWFSHNRQLPTFFTLGGLLVLLSLQMAWVLGEPRTNQFFQTIDRWQQRPPLWLQTPMEGLWAWSWPCLLLVCLWVITRLWTRPSFWPRIVVVGILALLTVRYLLWRSLSTLNVSTPLNGGLSLILYGMELLLLSRADSVVAECGSRDRQAQADQYAVAVQQGQYQPHVDILVPTYNESVGLLRRTLVGCLTLDYAAKTVHVLDDGDRPEVAALARQLGCRYQARRDRQGAKAGNLNYALPNCRGELVAVFDADFIPRQSFLARTVGFFQDGRIGLVQTPQSFYNPDPIAYNLDLAEQIPPEDEIFYRHVQPMRDGVGSVVCVGTSFVVRRQALDAIGGFVTESLSEDYFTGIRIAAAGYQLVYLNEKLSQGLAPESLAAYAKQRLRWARGTLQAFFIQANPLTVPGLNPLQRLGHLEGLLHWFSSLPRILFLVMPLGYGVGIMPLRATGPELLYFLLPIYLGHLTVFNWLNRRSRSALLSEIYSLVLAVPLAITSLQALVQPFRCQFAVTPKGLRQDRFFFNWALAWPLLILFAATWLSLALNVRQLWVLSQQADQTQMRGLALGLWWSGYNLVLLAVALLALWDAPRDGREAMIARPLALELQTDSGHVLTLRSQAQSEMVIRLEGNWVLPEGSLTLTRLGDQTLSVPVQHCDRDTQGTWLWLAPQPIDQNRLIKTIYCYGSEDHRPESPGERRSLLLILKTLLRPPILRSRQRPAQLGRLLVEVPQRS
uniref:UDP-glucose-beta-D-glucan glucosyltransferase n=1 Tax=Synechococcus elongatus (strain ATCC 33912 / PCC 7942 / FACHB-805) TaxID=1140 RepID=Q8GMT2_SYNE7|nr:UDP-glucose-beta-D-glucan glucosyltransferase [Synechococcus elongatus PCC 7942 = FACHB-805]